MYKSALLIREVSYKSNTLTYGNIIKKR